MVVLLIILTLRVPSSLQTANMCRWMRDLVWQSVCYAREAMIAHCWRSRKAVSVWVAEI